MEQTKFNGKALVFICFVLCCLTGCKTTRKAETSGQLESTRCLSSKVRLTVPSKEAVFTVNGTMKLVSGERMQLSFQMPIIRTEVARMDVTPEEILLVDRMGKRYVRTTRKELKDVLPKKADFARLEKILFDASKPGGKRELSGKELGIPSLEKGRIELSGFSNEPFSLTPTELSSKYTRVELNEILEMLMSL
ncbi:DUF4292 domain-containing protein [uncultured Bacteroides sp.]|uniref:DUF4292 domain-containing protein n=1 Tax=uncultured Bacteroides sp. TaxID=162156 RepID=UPI0025F51563|nr:DUF4292 domain-containing protein [uncultured Bacteroides sp.]